MAFNKWPGNTDVIWLGIGPAYQYARVLFSAWNYRRPARAGELRRRLEQYSDDATVEWLSIRALALLLTQGAWAVATMKD